MTSQSDVADALTAFYKQVVRFPHLDDAALRIPPSAGWETVDSAALRELGKSEAVIELLRHLPYLGAAGRYDKLLVQYETVAIAYTKSPSTLMEQVNPLPGNCVYVTEGVDREGYSLILDVEKGTITAYSVSGYEISPESREEYDSLPRSEQWRAHRTLPAVDFFKDWTAKYARLVDMLVPNAINGPTIGTFRTRAKDRRTGERLTQETGPLEEWHPDPQTLVHGIEDDQARQREEARWGHVANVYNSLVRHGWPDSFDKSACRADVLEMEKQAWALEKAVMDANNPDAALFDD